MILTHQDFQKTYNGSFKARICPVCGINFWSTNERAKYCSHACRQRAYLQRARGIENGILNTENEENNNEIFNDNNMSESQLIAEMQKNNALSIELALLKKDHEILKEKLTTFQDQSKHIGKLQIENEELNDRVNELEEENGVLQSKNGAEAREATEVLIKNKKELQQSRLEARILRCILTRKDLTISDVAQIYPQVKLEESDNLETNGLIAQRKAGEKTYKLKY